MNELQTTGILLSSEFSLTGAILRLDNNLYEEDVNKSVVTRIKMNRIKEIGNLPDTLFQRPGEKLEFDIMSLKPGKIIFYLDNMGNDIKIECANIIVKNEVYSPEDIRARHKIITEMYFEKAKLYETLSSEYDKLLREMNVFTDRNRDLIALRKNKLSEGEFEVASRQLNELEKIIKNVTLD